MFCSKCGKRIEYNSPICLECISAMAEESQSKEDSMQVQPKASEERIEPCNENVYSAQNNAYRGEYAQPRPQPQPQPQLQPCYNGNVSLFYSEQPKINTPVAVMEAKVEEQVGAGEKSTRMAGFGIALAGTIISFVSSFLMIFSFTGLAFSSAGGVFLFMLTIASCVVSIVFGIKSIRTFVSVRREGNPVPIATLILGINGLGTAAFILLYTAIVGTALMSIAF